MHGARRSALGWLRGRLAGAEGERGAGEIQLFFAVLFLGLMVSAGLAVDGGAKIRGIEQATWTASQAARAAADQLAGPAGMGGVEQIDPVQARQVVEQYVAASKVPGIELAVDDVQTDGQRVTVSVSGTYHTIFLGIIFIDELHFTATGSATGVQVIDGQAVP